MNKKPLAHWKGDQAIFSAKIDEDLGKALIVGLQKATWGFASALLPEGGLSERLRERLGRGQDVRSFCFSFEKKLRRFGFYRSNKHLVYIFRKRLFSNRNSRSSMDLRISFW